jgi:molybdopterin molybdotransferase
MMELHKALDLMKQSVVACGTETVALENALHRILANEVKSDADIPAFNKSAMDGYACRAADIEKALTIVETISAGKVPEKIIGSGTCAKIMTGAMVPEGADMVVRVEDTVVKGGKVYVTGNPKNNNIRYQGEEMKQGGVLIPAGSLIKPQHIAVMASVGMVQPLVYKKPSVAVISTGDELVEPNVKPTKAQIRNSNALQLMGQLASMGIVGSYYGIANDGLEDILKKIDQARKEHHVILVSGGVSMGDYDFVPEALKETGFELVFHKINVKPGKPVLFARQGNTFCFGMPGNPVSSFIQFEILVKPFLYALQGYGYKAPFLTCTMGTDFESKDFKLLRFVPVNISDHIVEPLFYKGSAHINAIALADGIMELPVGISQLKKGDHVHVRLL